MRLLAMGEPLDGIKQHVIGGSGLKTNGRITACSPLQPGEEKGTAK